MKELTLRFHPLGRGQSHMGGAQPPAQRGAVKVTRACSRGMSNLNVHDGQVKTGKLEELFSPAYNRYNGNPETFDRRRIDLNHNEPNSKIPCVNCLTSDHQVLCWNFYKQKY